MFAKIFSAGVAFWSIAGVALAQTPAGSTSPNSAPAAGATAGAASGAKSAGNPAATSGTAKSWRASGSAPAQTPADIAPASADAQPPLKPTRSVARQVIAKVTEGPNSLPNDAGQKLRYYDISPYTARVTSTSRPEQAIVDWILRETGYEAWHSEPLAFLSADHRTLRVYHTPEMHAIVGEMVDRFVNSEAESRAFGLHVVTVGKPDWRAKAQRMLHTVTTQTQGVQAWLVAKEDAALLIADLRRRSDFREHSSPHLLVNNGQSTIVAATRPHNYVRDVLLQSNAWPGFQPQMGQIDEGFSLEFSPLLSIDGGTIDAVIKCHVDQIEKMIPVLLDVPTPVAPRQRTKIEVPQLSSTRLHERFRWPADQVLLISLGVVASPTAGSAPTVTLPLIGSPLRADLLVLVENKGKMGAAPTALRPTGREASQYKGRY